MSTFRHHEPLKYDGPHTTGALIRLLNEANDAMKPWAKGREPKDLFERRTWEMAASHATFFSALRHILEIGPNVPAGKSVDFVGYVLMWVGCVEHHHYWEEELYYPKFAIGLHTDEIAKEHVSFKAGLDQMQEYLVACLPKGYPYGFDAKLTTEEKTKDFDMAKLETIVWSFVLPLISHLVGEIVYLSPEKLRAAQTVKEMQDIDTWNAAYFKNQLPLDTFLTWLVLHVPVWSEFPPVPSFVKGIICRWIVYWKWRRWWQFAPSKPQ
ncbi:hypothetical protein CALCODRAFT_501588 [Calocera cornea HHB12733]|uniref:Hemerythrin-like domain-containing protein n=1 Tax=Calocera cornea HHB12733 TaxID=1353952 RepID=A0A165DK69_9BASI|nr:hypothetical protein CALCODRAFT_501588 [Calocera cornea HHB12733]